MSDGELRAKFQAHIPDFHWQSVETWSTGQGVPDSNYCGQSKEGWIEFKKTNAWRVDVSPEQVGWIERRLRNGGRCFVGVRRFHSGGPRKGDAIDDLWLFKGAAIRPLVKDPLTAILSDLVLGRWSGGQSRWNWGEVRNILLRE